MEETISVITVRQAHVRSTKSQSKSWSYLLSKYVF